MLWRRNESCTAIVVFCVFTQTEKVDFGRGVLGNY